MAGEKQKGIDHACLGSTEPTLGSQSSVVALEKGIVEEAGCHCFFVCFDPPLVVLVCGSGALRDAGCSSGWSLVSRAATRREKAGGR